MERHPTIEFVIAKYKEDVSWTEKLKDKYRVTIYDKSETGTLPNVGREAHTFLYHIKTRYHDLADVTVFLQGNPFDHIDCKKYNIHSPKEEIIEYMRTYDYPKTEPFLNTYKYRECNQESSRSYQCMFGTYRTIIEFNSGAQWIVKKEDILSKSYDFYETLCEIASSERHLLLHAWSIERLWPYIYDPSIKDVPGTDMYSFRYTP